MRVELVEHLRCPQSGRRLMLEEPTWQGDRVKAGSLVCERREHRYPIRDFVPRFVPSSNYADNFGMQWNKFRHTQLDGHSGLPISSERFWKATNWTPDELHGKWVLDAGCGAGRIAEIALDAGANVVALDYSSAVDACYANLQQHPNLHVVQGDIYALPFAKAFFPFVYSLGVLQHTPDVARASAALPPMVADGGKLCVDFYEKSWKGLMQPKYCLRPLSKHVPHERLFAMLESWVPPLMKVSQAVSRVPLVGGALRRLTSIVNYHGVLPLSERQHLEWSLLDTFDWFAPAIDNPQSARTVIAWLNQAGMKQIDVLKAGHLVGRGTVVHASGH